MLILISAPGVVRNVTVYSVTSTTIGIRWLEPYPPTGVINKYVVKWGRYTPYLEREAFPKTHSCNIWTEYVCADWDELRSGAHYVYEVLIVIFFLVWNNSCTYFR